MNRSSQRDIHRFRKGHSESVRDDIAVEEPLELLAGDRSLAVVMRTPGHDIELVRGLLQAEGVIRAGDQVSLQAGDNAVTLDMDPQLVKERWANRDAITSSACGVCGAAALAVLEELARPVRSDLSWTPAQVCAAPEALREHQELFATTGGLHGAALFDEEGRVLACREDVGRHNAVDKLVGWAAASGKLPLSRVVLAVSGRLSYEIVHKAVVAGLPIVVAVSAPSSLAVDLAERWRVTLAGFVRGDAFNVYSHPSRIQAPR